MRTLILSLAVLFIIASFTGSCRPSQQELRMMEQARTLLREAGVDPSTLAKRGEDITITYETTKATGGSDKILEDWGAIFGILQWYSKDDVHIVISIEGKPVAKVKADIDNIKKFSSGEIGREEFLKKVSFSVVS